MPLPTTPELEAKLDAMAEAEPDLGGVCGYCEQHVTNRDPDRDHRVTPIIKGGRGVECKRRGDYL